MGKDAILPSSQCEKRSDKTQRLHKVKAGKEMNNKREILIRLRKKISYSRLYLQ
jgi:hypothetical protein